MSRGLTPEAKAATTMGGMVSLITFNPNVFAATISAYPVRIQHRILDCFEAFIDHLCRKYDEQLWADDEDFELCVQAKRAKDALSHFRP